MTNVKLTAETQNLIDILKTPFLIVQNDRVVDVFSSKELARAAKSEDKLEGKIVDGLKCEFEIIAGDSELPDETISEADEAELAAALDADEAEEVIVLTKRGRNEKQVAAQMESKKLKRQVVCVETAEVFKTVFAMYTAKPDWMTMTQRNKLTKELFAAAKNGDKIVVEINGRHFELLEV